MKHKQIRLHMLLLNLLDTCPDESKPRQALQDHLILTCRFRSESIDESDQWLAVKRLELEWTHSILKSLDNMRKSKASKPVTNQLISGILEEIAIRKNSFQYCLGSTGIRKQVTEAVRNMEAASKPMTAVNAGKAVGPRQFLEAMNMEVEDKKDDDSDPDSVEVNS